MPPEKEKMAGFRYENQNAEDSGFFNNFFGFGGGGGGGGGSGGGLKIGGGAAAAGLGLLTLGELIDSWTDKKDAKTFNWNELKENLKADKTSQAIDELKGKTETQATATAENTTGINKEITAEKQIAMKDVAGNVQTVPPKNPQETVQTTPTVMPTIKDETDKNEEMAITGGDYGSILQFIKDQQKEQWAREDSIRKETQAREDNAWQRAVKDMQKAGVNPNLVNAGPAESGGGISNATGMDYSMWQSEVNKQVALLEELMQEEFKEDENTKDRFSDIFGKILSLYMFKALR